MRRKILFGSLAAAALLGAPQLSRADYYFQGPTGSGGSFNVYRAVTFGQTWDGARAQAAISTFDGSPGHLVTIGDVAENSLIHANAGGDWWIGLTDSGGTSTIDGATMGGVEAGTSTTTGWWWVTGEPYSDLGLWGGGEPNDWQNGVPGEDAAHKRGDGLWNDHLVGPTLEPAQGAQRFPYVIEYETNYPAAINLPPIPLPDSQWLIKTYQTGITNLADADSLIAGNGLVPGFPVTESTVAADTNDTFSNVPPGSGNFSFDMQVPGLSPTVDNDDFAVVGTGATTVNTTGTYTFRTTTDDGSRLRVSVNGGPMQQIITDDVLSAPHNADSLPLALNAGDVVQFEWTWFERGGGATGELAYSSDGTTFFLVGDDVSGLGPVDTAVSTYKQNPSPIGPTLDGPGNVEADALANGGFLKGQAIRPTFNINNSDAGGIFGADDQAPGFTGPQDNFMVRGTGFIQIMPGEEGTYTFASLTDDGSRLRIGGADVIVDDTYHGAGYPADQKTGTFTFPTAGFYPVEYQFFEAGGGAGGEVYVLNPDGTPRALLGDNLAGGLLVTQVPEPSTLVLGALGLFGLALGWIRKKFKK